MKTFFGLAVPNQYCCHKVNIELVWDEILGQKPQTFMTPICSTCSLASLWYGMDSCEMEILQRIRGHEIVHFKAAIFCLLSTLKN